MNKKQILEQVLLDEGKLSNLECLSGYPCWTNRLGGYINVLRDKYNISTTLYKDDNNNYKDCVYHLKGRKA